MGFIFSFPFVQIPDKKQDALKEDAFCGKGGGPQFVGAVHHDCEGMAVGT